MFIIQVLKLFNELHENVMDLLCPKRTVWMFVIKVSFFPSDSEPSLRLKCFRMF